MARVAAFVLAQIKTVGFGRIAQNAALLLIATLFIWTPYLNADPISAFIGGIEGVLTASATALAIIGLIVAGVTWMFFDGPMAEKVLRVALGACIVGTASAFANWLFSI